jgi:hypothetical protein
MRLFFWQKGHKKIDQQDRCRRLVVAVATVVATPGPVPEVAAAVRLESRSDAAGSGTATAGGIAAEASRVTARVSGGTVAAAAAAREDLLVCRRAQHWDGTRAGMIE